MRRLGLLSSGPSRRRSRADASTAGWAARGGPVAGLSSNSGRVGPKRRAQVEHRHALLAGGGWPEGCGERWHATARRGEAAWI